MKTAKLRKLFPEKHADFCDMLRHFGYAIMWARGVYVHHYGRKTAPNVPDLNRAFTAQLLKVRRLVRAAHQMRVEASSAWISGGTS